MKAYEDEEFAVYDALTLRHKLEPDKDRSLEILDTCNVIRDLYERRKILRMYPTGSRVIGGYTQYSDLDIVVLASDGVDELGQELQYNLKDEAYCGGSEDNHTGDGSRWLSVKTCFGTVNFIIVENMVQFSYWKESTQVAEGYGLWDKPTRIAFFDCIRNKRKQSYETSIRESQGKDASAMGAVTSTSSASIPW